MESKSLIEALEEAERAIAEATGALRAKRMSAGLTQSDIALAAGVEQSYISQIENDKRKATPKTLRAAFLAIQQKEESDANEGQADGLRDAQEARRDKRPAVRARARSKQQHGKRP